MTKHTNLYKNDANTLLNIYIPKEINGYDTLKCIVQLNVINANEESDAINLTEWSEYKDYYKFTYQTRPNWTCCVGELRFWLTVYFNENTYFSTNSVTFYVHETESVEEHIPECDIPLLMDLQTKTIANTAYINELKQGTVLLGNDRSESKKNTYIIGDIENE